MEETKRKAGAPKKAAEDHKHPVALRLTSSQKVKYLALGGGKWVRGLLDAAIALDAAIDNGH